MRKLPTFGSLSSGDQSSANSRNLELPESGRFPPLGPRSKGTGPAVVFTVDVDERPPVHLNPLYYHGLGSADGRSLLPSPSHELGEPTKPLSLQSPKGSRSTSSLFPAANDAATVSYQPVFLRGSGANVTRDLNLGQNDMGGSPRNRRRTLPISGNSSPNQLPDSLMARNLRPRLMGSVKQHSPNLTTHTSSDNGSVLVRESSTSVRCSPRASLARTEDVQEKNMVFEVDLGSSPKESVAPTKIPRDATSSSTKTERHGTNKISDGAKLKDTAQVPTATMKAEMESINVPNTMQSQKYHRAPTESNANPPAEVDVVTYRALSKVPGMRHSMHLVEIADEENMGPSAIARLLEWWAVYSVRLRIAVERQRNDVIATGVNLAIVLFGVWGMFLLLVYGHDQAVSKSVENLLIADASYIHQMYNRMFSLPVEALMHLAWRVEFGELDTGEDFTFQRNGKPIEYNDFFCMPFLHAYPDAISWVYFGTELGYFLAGTDEGQKVEVKEIDMCYAIDYVAYDSFRSDVEHVENISPNTESHCLEQGKLQCVNREHSILCGPDATDFQLSWCEYYGDTYAFGLNDTDSSGYVWMDKLQQCVRVWPYDPRHRPWYIGTQYSDDDVAMTWSEPYASADIGSTVLSLGRRQTIRNHTFVFAADVALSTGTNKLADVDFGFGDHSFIALIQYYANEPNKQGVVISSSDPLVEEKMTMGYQFNALDRTVMNPDGTFVEWDVPELLDAPVRAIENEWLPEMEEPRVFTRASEMVGWFNYADPIFVVERFTGGGFEGFLIVSVERSLFFHRADAVNLAVGLTFFILFAPMMYTCFFLMWPTLRSHLKMRIKRLLVSTRAKKFEITEFRDGAKLSADTKVCIPARQQCRSTAPQESLSSARGRNGSPLDSSPGPYQYVPPSSRVPLEPRQSSHKKKRSNDEKINLRLLGLMGFFILNVLTVVAQYGQNVQQGVADVGDLTSQFTATVKMQLMDSIHGNLQKILDINVVNNSTLKQHSDRNSGPLRNETAIVTKDTYLVSYLMLLRDTDNPIDMLYVMWEDGAVQAAEWHADDSVITVNEMLPNSQCFTKYYTDPESLKRVSEDTPYEVDCSFKPTARPWYAEALASSDSSVSLSDIYKISDGKDGVSAYLRFVDPGPVDAQPRVGVFAVDLFLETLNMQLLEALRTGLKAAFFVTEPFESGGALVITSDGQIYDDVYGKSKRLNGLSTDQQLINMVSFYFWYDWIVNGEVHFETDDILGYGTLRSVVNLDNFQRLGGPDWDVTIAFPVDYFLGDLEDWSDVSLMVSFGTLVIVTCVGVISRSLVGGEEPSHQCEQEETGDVVLLKLTQMQERIKRKLGKLDGIISARKGKRFLKSHQDLRFALSRSDHIRVGGIPTVVCPYPDVTFSHEKIPLLHEYPGSSISGVCLYRSKYATPETEEEMAKRYIRDAMQGRNVLDLIEFERRGDTKRRTAFYTRSSFIYRNILRAAMVTHLFLGFYEAPFVEWGDTPIEPTEDRRNTLLQYEIVIIMVQLLDLIIEILVNGLSYTDGARRRLRWDNAIRIVLTVCIAVDWVVRAAGVNYYTGWEERKTLLPYSSMLRPVLLVVQSETLAWTTISLFTTIANAKHVFVVLVCFLAVAASMGICLLEGVYTELLGRGFDNFGSAFTTMFIFIDTGENFPDAVYPAARESGWFKLFYMFFFIAGLLLLVSLIIAIFQKQYALEVAKLHVVRQECQWAGLVAAFVLLNKKDQISLDYKICKEFFETTCRTGVDFSALEGVSLNIRDFVNVSEAMAESFDAIGSDHLSFQNLRRRAYNEVKWSLHNMLQNGWSFVRPVFLLITGQPIYPQYFRYAVSQLVDSIVQMCILLHIWSIAMLSTSVGEGMSVVLFLLIMFYAFEMIGKVFAQGISAFWDGDGLEGRRFQKEANRVDLIIVSATLLCYVIDRLDHGSIMLEGADPRHFIVAIPVLRIFTVFQVARNLTVGLAYSLAGMTALFILLFVVIYISAALGVIAFAGAFTYLPYTVYTMPAANFDSLEEAVTTLFQLMGGESWSDTMYAAVDATSTLFTAVYFIAYIIIITLLFVNLFIGVVCDAYSSLSDRSPGQSEKEQQSSVLIRIATTAKQRKYEEDVAMKQRSGGGVVSSGEWNRRETSYLKRINKMKRRLFLWTAEVVRSQRRMETDDPDAAGFDEQLLCDIALDRNIPVDEWTKWIGDMSCKEDDLVDILSGFVVGEG